MEQQNNYTYSTSIEVEPQNSTHVETSSVRADFTDSRIPKEQRNFLQADKPKDIGPVEVALVTLLFAFKAIDHPVSFSHQTLALMLGCHVHTAKRAEQKLRDIGWISVTSRRGLSKLTSLNLDKLPTTNRKAVRTPSEDAITMRKAYLNKLFYLKIKLHKKQIQTLDWNSEKILQRCNGDMNLMVDMLRHAFDTAEHAKAARSGLYQLWKRWKAIERTYKQLQEN
jgi:hypothetical protein